jgi:hypothetical protein
MQKRRSVYKSPPRQRATMHCAAQLRALDARLDAVLQVWVNWDQVWRRLFPEKVVVLRGDALDFGRLFSDYLCELEARNDTKVVMVPASAGPEMKETISTPTKIPFMWISADPEYARHLVSFGLSRVQSMCMVFHAAWEHFPARSYLLMVIGYKQTVVTAKLQRVQQRYSKMMPYIAKPTPNKMGAPEWPSDLYEGETQLKEVTEECDAEVFLKSKTDFQYGYHHPVSEYNKWSELKIEGVRLELVFSCGDKTFILTFVLPEQSNSGWSSRTPPESE